VDGLAGALAECAVGKQQGSVEVGGKQSNTAGNLDCRHPPTVPRRGDAGGQALKGTGYLTSNYPKTLVA